MEARYLSNHDDDVDDVDVDDGSNDGSNDDDDEAILFFLIAPLNWNIILIQFVDCIRLLVAVILVIYWKI